MPRPRQITPAIEAAITARYAAGESATALAKEFSTTPVTVLNVARRCGATIRTAGRPRSFATDPSDEADIIHRHRAGEPIARIAESYGVEPASVWQFLDVRDQLIRRNRPRVQ